MNHMTHERNLLSRLALAAPAGRGPLLSLGGRIAGGALALAIAADQPFERTRVLAIALAVVALATTLPAPGWWAARLPWLGAGVLFFGGALLAHLAPGALMLVAGALAALGAALDDHRRGRMIGVATFFTGFGLTSLMVVAIILGIEG